jgi:hypothetical protein
MDVGIEHTTGVYESPILAEIGAFVDLTRGPQGPVLEDATFMPVMPGS